MQKRWQLQEAKNRFSEVVESALNDGPQTVTRRGKDAVVILSCAEYERLRTGKKSMVDFFRDSPLRGMDFDAERPRDLPRDFPLRDISSTRV